MTTSVLAWNSDPALHTAAVERMTAHAAADAFVQGWYTIDDPDAPGGYKGCFYGCLVAEIDPENYFSTCRLTGGNWQTAAERLLGIPEIFGRIAEAIFEALYSPKASGFAVNLTEAIQPGVDLTRVAYRWAAMLLTNPVYGMRQYVDINTLPALDDTVALLNRAAAGETVSDEERETLHWRARNISTMDMSIRADWAHSALLRITENEPAEAVHAVMAMDGLDISRRAEWMAETLLRFTREA